MEDIVKVSFDIVLPDWCSGLTAEEISDWVKFQVGDKCEIPITVLSDKGFCEIKTRNLYIGVDNDKH